MNILITGAGGQLGREIRIASAGSSDRFLFSDVIREKGLDTLYLDITDKNALRLVCESEGIDVIINCAAYTDVDRAEDDPGMARLLNATAPANLAEIATERDALLIHISTDYVFHGDSSAPIPEDWPADPLGVYGATKLEGEQAILASGCRSMILRSAWMFSPYGRNFVKTMRRLTAERDQLNVVFDQVGTPTYAADLAGFLCRLIAERNLDHTGIYNFTDEGVCSWYDFACAVRDLSGNRCEIRPCHTDEYPVKASRPHYSVLDKTKVKATFGLTLPHWYASLQECMKRIEKGEGA